MSRAPVWGPRGPSGSRSSQAPEAPMSTEAHPLQKFFAKSDGSVLENYRTLVNLILRDSKPGSEQTVAIRHLLDSQTAFLRAKETYK